MAKRKKQKRQHKTLSFKAFEDTDQDILDWWEGIDTFFHAGSEILIARDTTDVIRALQLAPDELVRIALDRGILKVHTRTDRGITITLGQAPCTVPPARADSGESTEEDG